MTSTECSLCGKEELCFTCHYCNGTYCSEHRLPESHGCPGLYLARSDSTKKIADSFSGEYEEQAADEDNTTADKPLMQNFTIRKPRARRRFSKTEVRDLLMASVLVVLVSLSVSGGAGLVSVFVGISMLIGLTPTPWWYPAIMIGVFLLSFMMHEMAHKFVAQHYGMWSEFRMTMQGYYLSLIAILFSFPIFGTGAVFTSAPTSEKASVRTKVAGPLSNLILGGIALAAAVLTIVSGAYDVYTDAVIAYVITLNSILGLFNMIPIEPFDGAAIMRSNRVLWAVTSVLLLALLVSPYLL